MLFVVTGGTIDKMPAYLPDGVTFDNDSKIFNETHLPEIIEQARYIGAHSIKVVCMLDSLDMNDAQREAVALAIEESAESEIIVTHGTDTMPDTARFLSAREALAQRTIVLTGAMLPFSVEQSDALFNVGSAIAYAQSLPDGVYVAMNGQAFLADDVRKDKEAGVFKTIG